MTSSLIHTLASMDQPIIPAAGDGSTMALLNQADFPAIYLDGALTTQTLLAEDNQGLLTLSEYAKFLRDMQLKKNAPLIGDLQSGFGSPLNTYYAAQELERSGADIIILNDQTYPSRSTDRPATTTPADLLGKARAAQDGLENEQTALWIKLEGLGNYGTAGILDRIHYLAKAGAQAIIIDHYQSDELAEIIASTPELPIMATWQPDTSLTSGITAWLDTGFIARKANQARQMALTDLKKGSIAYAEK